MSTPSCLTTSSVFERLAKPLVIMSARTKAASPIRLVCAVSASLSSNAECLGQHWNHNLLIASAIAPPKMAKAIAETARIARWGKELARLLTTSDIGRCFPVRQRRVKAANRFPCFAEAESARPPGVSAGGPLRSYEPAGGSQVHSVHAAAASI